MNGGDGAEATYDVIVHSAGRFEDSDRYWTEVPALSACMGEGVAIDEALDDTRRAIESWLVRTRGAAPVVALAPDYAL